MYLLINGEVCSVIWFQHHKPGKGGAFMKVKCKSVRGGQIVEKTFRASEKVPQAIVEKKTMQFLYKEGDRLVFMDTSDYSQVYVQEKFLAEKKGFLLEGEEIELAIYDGEVISAELPPQVRIKVIESAPGLKGDTVSGTTKKVKLETGLKIDVPLFINEGENILVDTRTGKYVSRGD